MKLKRLFFICLATSLLFACRSNPDLPEQPTVEPAPAFADRTVLVYLMADNSLSPFSTSDMSEMLEGIQTVNTQRNNLIVYLDRNGDSPLLLRLAKNSEQEIVKDTLLCYDKERNSVGVAEMTETFASVFDHFQAEHYGLVLWSHGDGWLPYQNINSRWIGQDTNGWSTDYRLNITDLHTVLQSAPHFEFLLFDACYMQSVEVAYELRDCVDYFIGSPTEIPGPGGLYQEVVPALFASSNTALAVAESYYQPYKQLYNGGVGMSNNNWTGGVSVAVLQSSKLHALAGETRSLLLRAQPVGNLNGIMCYDQFRSCNYHDLDGYMKRVAGSQFDYEAWKRSYEAAVIYRETTPMNYNTTSLGRGKMVSMDGLTGVSTYILDGATTYQNNFYRTLSWYKDTQAN